MVEWEASCSRLLSCVLDYYLWVTGTTLIQQKGVRVSFPWKASAIGRQDFSIPSTIYTGLFLRLP